MYHFLKNLKNKINFLKKNLKNKKVTYYLYVKIYMNLNINDYVYIMDLLYLKFFHYKNNHNVLLLFMNNKIFYYSEKFYYQNNNYQIINNLELK